MRGEIYFKVIIENPKVVSKGKTDFFSRKNFDNFVCLGCFVLIENSSTSCEIDEVLKKFFGRIFFFNKASPSKTNMRRISSIHSLEDLKMIFRWVLKGSRLIILGIKYEGFWE